MSGKKYYWITGFIIAGLIISFLLPVRFLINFYVDDGFFYLKIADNFVKGFGSTFDRVNPTNGYHPLWFLILSVFFYIPSLLSATPEFLVHLSVFLHFLLIFVSVYFTYLSFRIIYKEEHFLKWMLFTALISIPFFTRNFGMEVHLAPALLAIYIYFKAKEWGMGNNYFYSKIIIFALLGLSRTESFFSIVPVLILYESLSSSRKLKSLFLYSIPVYLVLIIYLFTNYYYFGHFFTISSTIKNSFPQVILIDNIGKLFKNARNEIFAFLNFIIFLFSSLFMIIKVYKEKNKFNIKSPDTLLAAAAFGYILYILLNLSFNREGLREWYLSGAVYISAIIISSYVIKRKNRIVITASFISILFIVFFISSRVLNSRNVSIYEYSKEIKNYLSPDDRIFQVDYCGFVGFFSERNLVNGDGLVNSFEFYSYLKNKNLNGYLNKYNIEYYSTYGGKIDSLSGKVIDISFDSYYGKLIEFPAENIVYRKIQVTESTLIKKQTEWFLVHF